MNVHPDLSVVIPTYNERDQIQSIVDQVLAACAAQAVHAEVLIVDDNSPDGTGLRAEELARSRPVRVLHRAGKLGLGSAVTEGIAAAAADIVGVMDADLSHPPALMPVLYQALNGSGLDMAVGSRYVAGGGTSAWSSGRLGLSRMACLVVRPLTPVRDAMSGFFVIRRDLAKSISPSFHGFKIGLELLVRSRPRSVAEIPYVFVGRAGGKSKMTLGEFLRSLRQVLALYALKLRQGGAPPRYQIVSGETSAASAGGRRAARR